MISRRFPPFERRTHTVSNYTVDTLLRWKHASSSTRSPDGPVFNSIRNGKALTTRTIQTDIERAFELVGIAGHSAHDLRHTYATHLYLASNDLVLVQRQLGHAEVTTTIGYISAWANAIITAVQNLYK